DAGQVRMLETGEQLRLASESVNGLGSFLWTQTALAHLLEGNQARIEVQVFCLIDGCEATSSNLCQDTITLFEESILLQETSRVAGKRYLSLHWPTTGHTECCQRRIICAAGVARTRCWCHTMSP